MELNQANFNRHILLVEDQAVNAKIVTHLLNQRGAGVITADNGKQAIDLFEKSRQFYYDIILTDIVMPEMSGTEAAQKIRVMKRADAKTIPIVALTASTDEEALAEYRKAGIDDVLQKPVQPSMIDSILEKWVPTVGHFHAPDEEAENDVELPELKSVNVQQALSFVDNDAELCRDFLKEYCLSIPERTETIHKAVIQRDFETYTIEFHKLRSATGLAGAAELSAEATALEKAGKTHDIISILRQTQRFLCKLNAQHEELAEAFGLNKPQGAREDACDMTEEHLKMELGVLLERVVGEKYYEAEGILHELTEWKHGPEQTELLQQLRTDMQRLSYDSVIRRLRTYLKLEREAGAPVQVEHL